MESNFYTHSFNTKRAGMLAKCTALLLSLVCSVCLTFSAKADGIGFNPTGTPARPGQIPVQGFVNMSYFNDPITQSVYVYLKAGESLSYEIQRAVGNDASSSVIYSIYSPNGLVISNTQGNNSTMVENTIAVVAETAGIWTVSMRTIGTNFWRYNIDARTDGADRASRIGGRVYTELLHLYQNAPTDISLYASTISGHKYDVTLKGYNGIGSRISSDQYGNVSAENCNTSLYKSVPINSSSVRDLNEWTCGAYNKLFFTPLDPTLPATAPRWNTTTNATVTEWLAPTPVDPVVTELAFSPSGSNPISGNFTFKISDYVGSGTLLLDLDNDGVYGGANDRSLTFGVASDETITVPFDGLGTNSAPLPGSSIIKAKVLVDRTGEVHFTMIDVEQINGLKIIRTTGDLTNADVIYWDDTEIGSKDNTTPIVDGTAGHASNTASGVHGWAMAGNSWGNVALIDNWAYIQSNATQEITVEGCDANAGTISR